MKHLSCILLLLTTAINAEVLFQDDFNDGSAEDWNVMSGSWYVNDSLQYETDLNGMSWNGDSSGVMSVTDYTIYAEVMWTSPVEQLLEIMVRARQSGSNWVAQRCQLYIEGDEVYLYDFSNEVIVSTYYSLSQEHCYWVRLDCLGDSLRAKVWSGSIEDEPGTWLLEGLAQSGPSHEGSIGLYAWQFGGDHGGVFDNILVESLELELDASTWGSIKTTTLE